MKTLLALTVSGSALTILLLVLRYILLKKMPSTVYYYAWLLVLLRFLLPLPGLVPPFPAAADSAPEAAAYTVQAMAGVERNDFETIAQILAVCPMKPEKADTAIMILRDEVTRPMGLNDTAFVLDAAQRARLAQPSAGKLPWLIRRGRPVPAHELGPALRGMGGLYSSAADCATFFSRCDVMKPGRLRARQLPSGRWIDYRFGMIYGGETFFCRDRSTGGQLVILRNVTSWPAAEDFEVADRLFCNSKPETRN